MRKIGTPFGLFFGVVCIFGAFFLEGGTLDKIILGPALIIVLGGTFAATMIGIPLNDFFKVFSLIKIAFFPKRYDFKNTIDEIVDFSAMARKEGILSLEREVGRIDNTFFQKFIKYAIDGTDPETIRNIGETEIRYITQRHDKYSDIFKKMGGYSPTMGIIGTVMGLITTLANAGSEPEILVRHIATAFIATLWGIFMANLVWLPIADKLKNVHSEEEIFMEIVVEGTLSIQAGEIPSLIRAKLYTILPSSEQPIEKKYI
jgi:chemotaxis protein MotA